ncbi:P-loop NTPase family protein [Mycolicibacterium palauense]|uniref:NACHT domain-containing protein n=1 Tax=Mycolicibacterium palauense TaxID=2034511 RepID=UPI000BFED8CF|nr:NACHT domain-containing protein [Mycolicibacterium palauense]
MEGGRLLGRVGVGAVKKLIEPSIRDRLLAAIKDHPEAVPITGGQRRKLLRLLASREALDALYDQDDAGTARLSTLIATRVMPAAPADDAYKLASLLVAEFIGALGERESANALSYKLRLIGDAVEQSRDEVRALGDVIGTANEAGQAVGDVDVDATVAELVEASKSASEVIAPEVLPNVDRVARLARAGGGSLNDVATPVAVIGEGGLGKSVLLRQLYDSFVGIGGGPAVPFLVLCSRIPTSAALTSPADIDRALGAAAIGARADGVDAKPSWPLTRLIDEIVRDDTPVAILLDTVDLILNDTNADSVASVLRSLAGRCSLWFSCREQEYLNFLDSERDLIRTRYQLPGLTAPDIQDWARRYTDAVGIDVDRRDAFLASLGRPEASAVCATPLRLAMTCDIYASVGAIPEDLTVTELYDEYWNRRIGRDRHGRVTAAARSQETTVEAIAKEMWQSSTDHLVFSAAGTLATDDMALERLRSDGVLKQVGGRYQFFHQTYGEYAIARLLGRAGSDGDLRRLFDLLDGGVATGLWPVARYLVTLTMSDERYGSVVDAIPVTRTEGVRLHFLGAFQRHDAERVVRLGQEVDKTLLSAGIAVVADAPRECLKSASDIAIGCLGAATTSDIGPIAATCVRLYHEMPDTDRPAFVRSFLSAVLSRHPYVTKETLPSVVTRFIANTVATKFDEAVITVFIDFYSGDCADSTPLELPAAARGALLKVVEDGPAGTELRTRLLLKAADCECPSGAVDAVAGLLIRNWEDADFRKAMGWIDIVEMLEATLPVRWDACQVRLADALCEDESTARGVLLTAFSDAPLKRDRWANVAMFIADRHRGLVLDTVLALPDDLAKPAVGTACSVVNHVADALTASQREALARRLPAWIGADPRRVWPSLIKVSTDDPERLRDCARQVARVSGLSPAQQAATIRSSYDTFLNACSPTQLADIEVELRALLTDAKDDRERLAELDGLVIEQNRAARERVTRHLDGDATNAAFAATRGVTAALRAWRGGDVGADVSAWLYSLLDCRHSNCVRLLATALDEMASQIVPPSGSVAEQIAARLLKSLAANDDPQTPASLIVLLIMLGKRDRLGDELRFTVVEALRGAVIERLPAETPEAQRRHLPALFGLYKQALAALRIPYCTLDEVQRVVRAVLTEFDAADIANRSRRPMAHLLITAANRDASVLPLVVELWPTVSDTNKGAIAECVMYFDANTDGARSKQLAGRDDCPIDIKNNIYTQFPL